MKRIYADMVADLFHRGHLEFLRKIKTLYPDSYLIVGIHSDATVESYKRKPIFSMDDRVAIVESCKLVDEVVRDAPLKITEEYLSEHRIDLMMHGDDMTDFFYECYSVPLEAGIVEFLPYYKGVSTSEIIENIRTRL